MQKSYRHILVSNDTGERLELQDAPVGWDATKFRLIRDLTYMGILKSISVEFEYVGDGFEFMQRHRMLKGVDADIIHRVYLNNPNEFLFEGKVNQENYIEDRKFRKYKCDIIQSSFVQKFQNREDVELNVLNTLSLDRKPVAPVQLKNATIRGRSIEFLTDYTKPPTHEPGDPDLYSHLIPMIIKTNGNDGATDPQNFFLLDHIMLMDEYNTIVYAPENAFYLNTLNVPQPLKIRGRVDVSITNEGIMNLPFFLFEIDDVYVFQGQRIEFNIKMMDASNNIVATLFNYTLINAFGNHVLNIALDLEVPPMHYLVFACDRLLHETHQTSDGTVIFEAPRPAFSYATQDDFPEVNLDVGFKAPVIYNEIEFSIVQNSGVPDTMHNVLLPFELFSNLLAQINGGVFVSDFFGRQDLGYTVDGDGAYLAITTGTLLRGIPLEEIQIPTTFREAFSSYSSVFCLGALISGKELRIEPLDRLFNANVAAELGEVKELTLSPTKEFLFNSVKAGYPPNEYEEQNGRDEFNTTYQFTNQLQAVKKELDLVSKYYGDGYGIEFARRQSIVTTGTKDTKYDAQIFFIDLIKLEDGSLISRRQEGILYVSGIFSPETAMNLRIAVGQNMLRHRKYLNVPLNKKEKLYHFQSKDKNAGLQLVTPLGSTVDGEDIQTGNGFYFIPEDRKFKCPLTLEQFFAILANPLGMVSYTYDGEKFFDHLFEVDAETEKGTAEWRMLGTKDTPIEKVEDMVWGPFIKYGDGMKDFVKYGDGPDDFILYQ